MASVPMATAPMTTIGAPMLLGLVTTAGFPPQPDPITSAPPPTAVFTPEQVTNTLRDLVTAVQGLLLNQYHKYMAGPYAPPPAAPIAAYGHPTLPWPSQGAPAYSGQLSVSKLADLR